MKYVITGKETMHPFNKHWKQCVGSDHAKQAMRSDYVKQLKQIHDELGIQYVRFHGIFNDDMETVNNMRMMVPVPGLENFTEYNFHNCGVVYDNVLAAGMKPFVELSFMPSLLASGDTQGSMWYVKNVTSPADYERWADYIRKFIEFLLHRYGAEEVETWYFEVWNEPDLAPTFFGGTQKDYFKLYETTARTIKEVNEHLRVGGPSTSGSKWVRVFRTFCEDNKVPLDFLSTHQYAGDPLGGIEGEGIVGEQEKTEDQILDLQAEYIKNATRLMSEMEKIEDKTYLNGWQMMMPDKTECEELPDYVFRTNSAIVRKQAEGYPLFYTEWNMNSNFSSWTNDTRKIAAYDVRAALDVEQNMDGSSLWCFSDIFEEMHQFPEQFHGGFGMLTMDGIPKPAYYAMRLLGQVADNRIELNPDATAGEVGIGAFRDEKRMDLVLFRQKMKNLDLPKEKAEVSVRLDHKPSKVVCCKIDAEHGNPYELWVADNKPANMNPQEVKDLIDRSAVREEEVDVDYQDGQLQIQAELGVNDVYFYQIQM